MIRLIASDIDGTLLPEGDSAIDPAVFEEIRRLRQEGVLFCPVSGRQYTSMRRLFAPVADELFYITENGAAAFGPGAPGPVLGRTPMERNMAVALCRDIMEQPDCEVLISGLDTSYLCTRAEDVVTMMRDVKRNNVAFVSRPEDVPEDILKVAAFCRHGARAIQPVLGPRWEGRCRAAIAGWEWLDFNQTDKGEGLLKLCGTLRVPPEQVAAFGDNYNDLAMLEAVGHPYIMENADAGLRARFPNWCRRVADVLRRIPEKTNEGKI